jgi:uncharacterized protein YjbI with pentapeptide repeats
MWAMAQRRTGAPAIGAAQAPDVAPDQLERIELDALTAELELEYALVSGASLGGADAASVSLRHAQLQDVDLGASRLRAVEIVDVLAERLNAANGDWAGAQIRRARFGDARLTGLSLAEARLEEVSFKACKLDYANFRHSRIEHASFEACVLTGADFQGASIKATSFAGCQLEEADFSGAELSLVDLRGSELALAGSLLGLSGAIIDPLQLIELAHPLAREIGVTVADIGSELDVTSARR